MAENSKIEWTDHTFNPWIGCQKVSPGCDNCYAEAMMDHRYGKVKWGPHGERKRTSEANWKLPARWARQAHRNFLRGDLRRPRVFCASLADWLDNQVPQQWRSDLAHVISATPELDWLLLTKRIENFRKLSPWGSELPFPSNVWLGITCEDQGRFDRRWPVLAQIPAAVRFISYEPAIERLRLPLGWHRDEPKPNWIICGGESGPGARQMNPGWARDLRSQCAQYDIAFFMKQMTSKAPIPYDLMIRQFPVAA